MTSEFRPIDRALHTILVVDDDPASRYATARQLQSAGFQTREASTGIDGLELADHSISAMVLDIHLPDIDGFELCRRLRMQEGTSRLPVLHLSAAYVTDEDKVRGLDAGADAYLTHPVEPPVLVATVQALVRTRVAEDAMLRSEAKFRAIYEQAPGGICLLDQCYCILDANPAMLAFLGRKRSEVIDHSIAEFVPSEWAGCAEQFFRQLGGFGERVEFPVSDPHGAETHLEWTLSPHIEAKVTMAVATDVSQRNLIEHRRLQLLESERVARSSAERISRMKDDLIAVLSHELRTPLNAMLGWTHVLQLQGGSESTMSGLAAIERNGRMQARMISDILDMSRLNSGKMPLTLELVDPAEVVGSALNALQPSIADRGQEMVVDLRTPHRHVRVDGSRLQQIIWNLVSNAIKFSPHGAQIRVMLRDEPDGIRLTVADDGEGIEPDFLPYLFDRFTQSDAGKNRLRGGLGLGLSIVKHLVEAHGGTIAAFSEGAGRGTTFDVWLPLDQPDDPNSAEPVDTSGEDAAGPNDADKDLLKGLTLLIVDDDVDASLMLAIILGDRGAEVSTASSYQEALDLLGEMNPDAVISDIGMPGKDGYDLVREIRRRERGSSRRVTMIALTSFTRSQDEEAALAAGYDIHCTKPLRPMKLVQSLKALTGGPTAAPPA